MNRWHFDQQVDLKSGAGDVIWPSALMMEGDNEAHAWQVQVRDGGKAVDVSQYGITAYFQRTDGKTVVVIGSAEGDKATVLLPQSAYAVPGQLLGVMRASMGGSNLTLAACRWTVRNAPDGDYIDPGHVVPSLPELLDRIAEMESATAAANAAAGSVSDAKAAALNAAAEALAAAEDAEAARQAADQAAKAATDATKTAGDAWQALTGDVTQAKNAAEEAAEAASTAAAKATEAAGSVDASKAAAQAAAAEARAAADSVDDAKGEALAAAETATAAAQAADEAREGIQGEISALKGDLSDNAKSDAETGRKLDYLWKLNQGISYQFETDVTEAYSKTVPSGAKLASVISIGGHTEAIDGELVNADIESVKYNDAVASEIPEAVRNLQGYGWSAGDVHNSIERTDTGWQYVQRVGKYVFAGTESWSSDVGYCYFMNHYFDNGVKTDKANFSTSVEGEYLAIRVRSDGKGIIAKYSNSSVKLTLEEIKSRFSSGKILHYEYETPIITDITDLMADFPAHFEVEPGGTITMENAAMLPVPSTEKYLIAMAEVNQ